MIKKIIKAIVIAFLLISILIVAKFKTVYAVVVNDEIIGYVSDKESFQEQIDKKFATPENENIAFVTVDSVEYETKIASKNIVNEEETLEKLKDNAKNVYRVYEISYSEDEEAIYVYSQEEAEEIAQNLKEQYSEIEPNLTIQELYIEKEVTEESIKLAKEKAEQDLENKKAEKKQQEIDAKTINGIYIACTPVSVGRISSRYGSVESIRDHVHQGLDIAAAYGTPIKSAADGTVISTGRSGGYGNLVIVDHGNGVQTYYGHCSSITSYVGQQVKAGDVIAKVGSTGNSTGNHLHFEIRLDGKQINPEGYIY